MIVSQSTQSSDYALETRGLCKELLGFRAICDVKLKIRRNDVRPNVLKVSNLHAFYADSHIPHGIELSVDEGELVCLFGRNGSGRTTTLRAIMGLTGKRTGDIQFVGHSTMALASPARRRYSHGGQGLSLSRNFAATPSRRSRPRHTADPRTKPPATPAV